MLWFLLIAAAQAGDARIAKVLPHYLDAEGRHALSPSLYERDAYQAHLRRHPDERAGLRFDIQWKSRGRGPGLELQIEARGSKQSFPVTIFRRPVRARALGSKWTSLVLPANDYRALGDLTSWRASLWQGDRLLAEQKSLLW